MTPEESRKGGGARASPGCAGAPFAAAGEWQCCSGAASGGDPDACTFAGTGCSPGAAADARNHVRLKLAEPDRSSHGGAGAGVSSSNTPRRTTGSRSRCGCCWAWRAARRPCSSATGSGARDRRFYGQALAAAGIAFLFLSAWASFGLYHLVPQPAGFALMVTITAAAGWLALRYDSPAVALLGLGGGFRDASAAGRQQCALAGVELRAAAGCGYCVRIAARGSGAWPEGLALLGTVTLYCTQLPLPPGYAVFLLAYYALFASSPFLPVFLMAQGFAGLAWAGLWGHEFAGMAGVWGTRGGRAWRVRPARTQCGSRCIVRGLLAGVRCTSHRGPLDQAGAGCCSSRATWCSWRGRCGVWCRAGNRCGSWTSHCCR